MGGAAAAIILLLLGTGGGGPPPLTAGIFEAVILPRSMTVTIQLVVPASID
jgi:hypothetical protein